MEHIPLDEWIQRSGLTKSYVAATSGVSRSTIHRIQNGDTDPSIGTLRELAIACGYELDVRFRPLADPFAAQAARLILEENFIPDNCHQVQQWIKRFDRVGLEDPVSIIEYAGRASGLLHLNKPSAYLRGQADDLRLASAADAAGAPWALSGQTHLQLGIGDVLAGVKVLWTEEPRLVMTLLADTMKTARVAETSTVVVAKSTPAVFQGSFEYQGMNFVAPIQALIDGFSLGGQLAEAAKTIARKW